MDVGGAEDVDEGQPDAVEGEAERPQAQQPQDDLPREPDGVAQPCVSADTASGKLAMEAIRASTAPRERRARFR